MAKVLVVEDDPALLQMVALTLTQKGHQVAVAENGEAALRLVESAPPDVVVTDLLMPVLDGYELLSQLKARPETSAIPVVVLSELQGKESRLVAFRLGCDDFLPKPFELEELCIRVEHALTPNRPTSKQLSTQPPDVKLHGYLDDVALPSVLNMLALDRRSGVLELKARDFCVRLFLVEGRVIHAEDASDPTQEPFDVVCRALRLRQGKFAVHDEPVSVPERLHLSMTELLLDAFERNDEEDAKSVPGARA